MSVSPTRREREVDEFEISKDIFNDRSKTVLRELVLISLKVIDLALALIYLSISRVAWEIIEDRVVGEF